MTEQSALPPNLLERIMRRLGLERQLAVVRRNLGLFSVLGIVFCVVVIFALIGLRTVLMHSSFGPFASLAFSDPGTLIRYRQDFMLSMGESIPGFSFVAVFASVGFLMLCARCIAGYVASRSSIVSSIQQHTHEHQ